MSDLTAYLDQLQMIDWHDPDIYRQVSEILNVVSRDKVALGKLVRQASRNPSLFDQFECHAQFDRFVLYDALDTRGFRIRLHIWHDNKFDLPHQHRYHFGTKILRGGYRHIIYTASEQLLGLPVDSPDARPYQAPLSAEAPVVDFDEQFAVRKEFECLHKEGDVYCLSPDILHSSSNTGGNVSLFIRGPAVRNDALELELGSGKVFRRHAKSMETLEQRAANQMSHSKFAAYVAQLERWDILANS